MKNVFLLVFVCLFAISCTKKDSDVNNSQNYFKVNAKKYVVDKAYYTIDSFSKYTEIAIVSSGITYDANLLEFKGTGNAITFEIEDITSVLKSGTYSTPDGFWSAVGLNYNSLTQFVNLYEIKETVPGKLTITKNNSNYNIQFEFTLESGEIVTGQYIGTVKKERF